MKCIFSFNPVDKITGNNADTEGSHFRSGKCAPSIMAVGTSSNGTEKPSLHALFVMHFTIQFEFGNEQGWMMRATRAAFYTRFPAKVPCVMLHKRGIFPLFILSSAPTHKTWLFLLLLKRKGGQRWWKSLHA